MSLRNLLPLLFLVILPARAELIAYDNFDSYPAGAALGGLAGGSGWSEAWSGVSGVTISDESISYQIGSRVLGGGNALKIAANKDNALSRAIALSPDTSGRDYFVSFIFQIKGGTPGANVTGDVFTGWQAWGANPHINNDNIGYLGGSGRAGARVKKTSTAVTPPASLRPNLSLRHQIHRLERLGL